MQVTRMRFHSPVFLARNSIGIERLPFMPKRGSGVIFAPQIGKISPWLVYHFPLPRLHTWISIARVKTPPTVGNGSAQTYSPELAVEPGIPLEFGASVRCRHSHSRM